MLREFFINNLDIVFLVYGSAFFVMGIVTFAQPRRVQLESAFPLSRIIRILAGFGIVHGLNEWLDMIAIIRGYNSNAWNLARAVVLFSSYVFLFEFGRRLILLSLKRFLNKWVTVLISCLAIALIFMLKQEPSIWLRYLLGFSGSALTAFGFFSYYRSNKAILEKFDVRLFFLTAAVSAGIYSILGGIVVPKADFFPAALINNSSFSNLIGVPVQVFRAVCAIFLAWSVWNILRIFDWEMEAKLINSEKFAAMGRMAGIIGHEFRNQLGVMETSISFLKMKLPEADEKVKRHLAILEQQIMESNRIIENILTFSKTRRLDLKSVDLGDLLSVSIGKVQNPNGIPVVMHIDKVFPRIQADEIQLTRAFVNIISNALQAMGEKGKLTIEASRVNDWVRVLFKDTGPGIKEEDKKRLFEPFFSTKTCGVGLGLAMSKSVVEAHGGIINIESKFGKGTVVTVKLPARE